MVSFRIIKKKTNNEANEVKSIIGEQWHRSGNNNTTELKKQQPQSISIKLLWLKVAFLFLNPAKQPTDQLQLPETTSVRNKNKGKV
jgi:hypothetical protein